MKSLVQSRASRAVVSQRICRGSAAAALAAAAAATTRPSSATTTATAAKRCVHASAQHYASVGPLTASGPPPTAPEPSVEQPDVKIARRKKQAELLKKGQELRAAAGAAGKGKGSSPAVAALGGGLGRKRFWKDVHVHKTDEGYQIYLDTRPLRTASKEILTVPLSKPHLATALALEWDLLTSAQQALRHHLIPLTSLVSRALDIRAEDEATAAGAASGATRLAVAATLLRYLDTDSLLCWAPLPPPDPPGYETHAGRTRPLRELQREAAAPIIGFLRERVWPGAALAPVLDDGDGAGASIVPRAQDRATRGAVEAWVLALPAWELAALERAVLAGKGMLGAARLVVEWSEEMAHLRRGREGLPRFGVDEAARAASLEVAYQTDMWGEVEDTHDVDKEDLRRQLGSVVLMVAGEKGK